MLGNVPIEEYRSNPGRFNALGLADSKFILESVVGPLEDVVFSMKSWPDSLFRIIGPQCTILDYQSRLISSMLENYATRRQFKMVAALMLFFRVEDWFDLYLLNDKFNDQIFKAFAFGSLFRNRQVSGVGSEVIVPYLLGLAPWSFVLHWLNHGTLYDTRQDFSILDAIKETSYRAVEVVDGFRDLPKQPLDQRTFIVAKCILARLSQRRFLSFKDGHPGSCLQYACHLVHFIGTANLLMTKPHWSRHAHRKIATHRFHEVVKTVLAMRLFRHDVFPFHKDLLDMLIQKLFEFELERLDTECLAESRTNRYFKLSFGEEPAESDGENFNTENRLELVEIGLRFNILLELPQDPRFHYSEVRDVLILQHGGSISEKQRAYYTETLIYNIVYFKGCAVELDFYGETYEDRMELGVDILKYCQLMNVKLFELWLGTAQVLESFVNYI
jgi:hypothetical protein